jgi:ribosomal protein S17E
MAKTKEVKLTFSRIFGISKKTLDKEGFFDISLASDLPLFIDPFHLFYSDKDDYRALHEQIIKYLAFLRDESLIAYSSVEPPKGIIDAYYRFPEVKQNWFGYSFIGNKGHGLGKKFALALNQNFAKLFNDKNLEHNLRHLEKLTLISNRVGKDTISDFTTNLIHAFLAEKTQNFARKYIKKENIKQYWILKAEFDYSKNVWIKKSFFLPSFNNDYVLLTPRDLLTKNDTWINKTDFIDRFNEIPNATTDAALREQLSRYLNEKINEYAVWKIDKRTKKEYPSITKETKAKAARATIERFPQTIDIYIGLQEKNGDVAIQRSKELVAETENILQKQFLQFAQQIDQDLKKPTSYEESYERAIYFKKCIEERGCYKNLYNNGIPVDEDWIQRMFWFVWGGSISYISREPDTGSGEPDFVASQGKKDNTPIEFKLAKSKTLEDNLLKQLKKYKEVEEAKEGIWVIVYFTAAEGIEIRAILERNNLEDDKNYILVDARDDNKVSASKLKKDRNA